MSKAASRQSKFAELRALRKSGKKAFDTYEVDTAENLYEEVDENQYKKIVRDRLNQDDFVVDDNGEGYADDGREEWDRVQAYDTDSDDERVLHQGKDRKAGRCSHVPYHSYCLPPVTDSSQPRKHARTSRRSAMPTTGTSPSTSPRALAKTKPSQRYVASSFLSIFQGAQN